MKFYTASLVGLWSVVLLVTVNGLDNGVGATPAMGWNSWNYFRCNVNESVVMSVADALVESGLRDLGYEYVVIDDCWAERRDAGGVIQPFLDKFPSGMKALADYVHSKGLRFGLYTDAGNRTCEGYPGSWGHEELDAATYANWGVDFVKYDYCGMEKSTVSVEASYTKLRDALNKTGRPFYYSMCSWGHGEPWLWGKQVGHSWRVSADLYAAWDTAQASSLYLPSFLQPVLTAVEGVQPLSQYAGPGGFNDPDMLVVGLDGMYPYGIVPQCPPHVKGCKPGDYVSRERWGRQGGLSFTEQKTHFALWCILSSPLILGNDPRNMSAATLQILKAKEFLEVNQDRLAKQGVLVWSRGELQLWRKDLAGGSVALLLFNKGSSNANIQVEWEKDLPDLHKKWAKMVDGGKVKCKDKSPQCPSWALNGECEKNPGYMLDRCQLSCKAACPELEWHKKPHSNALVRDLWWREDLGVFWDSFTAERVEPHEGRMLKVTFVKPGTKPDAAGRMSKSSPSSWHHPWSKKQEQQAEVQTPDLTAAKAEIQQLKVQLHDAEQQLHAAQILAAQRQAALTAAQAAPKQHIPLASHSTDDQDLEDWEKEEEQTDSTSYQSEEDGVPPARKLRRVGNIKRGTEVGPGPGLHPSMNLVLLLCNLMLMAAVVVFGFRLRGRAASGSMGLGGRRYL